LQPPWLKRDIFIAPPDGAAAAVEERQVDVPGIANADELFLGEVQ